MSNPSNEHINEAMNSYVTQPVAVIAGTQVGSLLAVNNTTFYTETEAFAGNPDGLLGSVMQIRSLPSEDGKGTQQLLE